MRVLMIGPPGCGKGTQSIRIADHYGIEHISSGDLLRRHVIERTTIGRAVEQSMHRGDLVPDHIVMDILRKPVEAASRRGGYVLDGFPRTVAQAEAAYRVAEPLGAAVRIALHLQADRAELIRRLLARGAQTGRTDDTEQVISHRLDVFDEAAGPLLNYYRQRETLITVNGQQPVPQVTAAAISRFDQVRQRLGIPDHLTTTVAGHHEQQAFVSAITPARATPAAPRDRRHTGPGRYT
ncbi:adenylate kinase [Actinoplanes solisilvae]|uniref:adenylate kinase n=1 Tax=Actinoplanes solisilvae TaxID=2486853 RepID=UPI000FD8AB0E|nr:adenylate kinase [Actinoplanes solisilvae]